MKHICLIILLLFINAISKSKSVTNDEEEIEEFVATNEWQIVRKGQKIPAGLHIRMNLEAGVTEAKLMDPNETHDNKNAVLEVKDENADNPLQLNEETIELVQKMLKKIKPDDPQESVVDNIFRSYEELKKDFEELNLKATMDSELMQELIDKHENEYKMKEVDEDVIKAIIIDLEYYVHQIDNALNFIKMNGYSKVAYKNLNSTNVNLKMEALKLLGSSLQNNIKVQIHVLETGGLLHLMRLLASDADNSIKIRTLYPLGALLRKFPIAQQRFVENGGINIFAQLFEISDIKLHIKLMTLIYDLLLEQLEATKDINNTHYNEKLKQYNAVSLKEKLINANYCQYFADVLQKVIEIDKNDYDVLEKCVLPLEVIINECNPKISANLYSLVHKLLDAVNKLSFEEQFYLEDYMNAVRNLYRSVVSKKEKYKLEL